MSKVDTTRLPMLPAGIVTVVLSSAVAQAQNTTVIEEKQVLTRPISQTIVIERKTVADAPLKCSNYDKRFSDLLDQINLGESRGWLTAEKAQELRNWRAGVVKELALFRDAAGGILGGSDAAQLERHTNGLAFMINKEIGAGSAIAGVNAPVY